MNKTLIALACVMALAGGCVTTSEGQTSVQTLEEMSELDYNRLQTYVHLSVKIAANRLLQEEVVSKTELDLMAGVIETVATKPVQQGAGSILKTALTDAGFTNDEATLVVLLAEQELLSRGGMVGVLDPQTGLVQLSERSKGMLQSVADALRASGTVTQEEVSQLTSLKAMFAND